MLNCPCYISDSIIGQIVQLGPVIVRGAAADSLLPCDGCGCAIGCDGNSDVGGNAGGIGWIGLRECLRPGPLEYCRYGYDQCEDCDAGDGSGLMEGAHHSAPRMCTRNGGGGGGGG